MAPWVASTYLPGVTFRVIDPGTLGPPKGWNHGMLAEGGGRILFVAGQTAREEGGGITSSEVAEQWERALRNVMEVVRAAGGRPEHVGRLTIYVTNRAEYLANRKPIGEAYRRVMGRHFPAIALVEVSGLVDEGARVEIEATAVLPACPGTRPLE